MKRSILIALFSAAVLLGCGEPLSVWHVSVLDLSNGIDDLAECREINNNNQKAPEIPPNTNTAMTHSEWEIHEGAEDKYYLNANGTIYEGTLEDKTYKFESVQKVYGVGRQGPEGNVTATTLKTTTTTYELTVDGNFISGTMTRKYTNSCTGNCNEVTEALHWTPSCLTNKEEITGVKLDPELRHNV
ncbi:MAG: hypothetical protein FWD46_04995 [Cystobacterineae bacterium]|nr:hypothetical protein [Cystobacterineae bacterium]